MRFVREWTEYFSAVALAALCAGCSLSGDGEYDEQKDTYYLQGKRRQQSMDYRGAVESFEKALEANPKSSSAHFELGLLYAEGLNKDVIDSEKQDLHQATAIYHFEKFLALNPQSPLADRVRQQITACKLELAKTVSFTLLSSSVHKELERLNATNSALHELNGQLKLRLAQQAHTFSNQYVALYNQYVAALGAASNRADMASSGRVPQLLEASSRTGSSVDTDASKARSPDRPGTPSGKPLSSARDSTVGTPSNSYEVRSGDTLASIARSQRITLSALMAANPGVEPRRLRTGQKLKIPTPNNR